MPTRSTNHLVVGFCLALVVVACEDGGGFGDTGDTESNPDHTADVQGTADSAPGVTSDSGDDPTQIRDVDAAGDALNEDVSADVSEPAPPTYYDNLAPILAEHCMSCHGGQGPGPYALDDWSIVEPLAGFITDTVLSGAMPPGSLDESCRPLEDSPALSPQELDVFARWREGGYAAGEPRPFPETPQEADLLGEADIVIDGRPFRPDRDAGDQFDGYELNYIFSRDTWLVATSIAEVGGAVIHHANAFLRAPSDGGDGHTVPIAGFAPGFAPMQFPEDAALFLPAGSRIDMEIHFSTVTWPSGVPVPEVYPRLELWTWDAEDLPEYEVALYPVSNGDLDIRAGDPESVQTGEHAFRQSGIIVGGSPHMHLLGTRFEASVERADGESICLFSMPEYDFYWQRLYMFDPSAWVEVQVGDVHHMDCVFDNSVANQPVVNGEQISPRDVQWGGDTLDEMCIDLLIMLVPREPEAP